MSNLTNRTVSNRYLTINTTDLLTEALKNLGSNDYQLRTIKSRHTKSTREKVEVKFPTFGYTDPTGSPIVPMVIIENSFNGECSLTVQTGFFRQVCSNGLMLAVDKHSIGRIVHLKAYHEQVKQLSYKIAAFLESVNAQQQELKRIAAIDVGGMTTAMNIVSDLNFSPKLTKNIRLALLFPSRENDKGSNLYTLWNVVNEQMRKVGRSESAQIDKNLTLLERLESAYLKAA